MKPILEYIISKSTKAIHIIHATDETIKKIVKDELDRLGHDANLNHIDVSEVTNMDDLFSCHEIDLGSKYKDLNPDISEWNVSKVRNMQRIFAFCKNFNQDISRWDVRKVEDMYYMFYHCENFNKDLSDWNVGKVENMYAMFAGCYTFNQDLSNWDVSKVEHMNFMFDDCPIKEEFKPHFTK